MGNKGRKQGRGGNGKRQASEGISGSSNVYIVGQGVIPIEKLFERFQSISPCSGTGRCSILDVSWAGLKTLSADLESGMFCVQRITRLWKYEVPPNDAFTVRIDRGGRITASSNQLLLIWNGRELQYRQANELVRGNALLGPNSTTAPLIPKRKITLTFNEGSSRDLQPYSVRLTPEIGWLIGYFLGDGNFGTYDWGFKTVDGKRIYQWPRLKFVDETLECLTHALDIIETNFGQTAPIQRCKSADCYRLIYSRSTVTAFFGSIFKPGPKTYNLPMPPFIWNSGVEIITAFLAGLFDSDGTGANGQAMYSSVSCAFVQKVAALANLYGFGGGRTSDGDSDRTEILKRTTDDKHREQLLRYSVHPQRRAAACRFATRRKFCLPLGATWENELFREKSTGRSWGKKQVGNSTVDLRRLHYEAVIEPIKLQRVLKLLKRYDLLGQLLERVCESAGFVMSNSRSKPESEFFGLSVEGRPNYLAGEYGMVVVHAAGTGP